VLGKDPSITFLVIDEVEMEGWGLPVAKYRKTLAAERAAGG
jgi:phenylpyruvate tautomerase PptA (4-oxalocrotonate tautomerase family)